METAKERHHVMPYKTLIGILCMLLILTAGIIGISMIDLGKLNVWVALLIASVKCSLTAIALSMFYIGWSSYIDLRNVPPGAIEIDVFAQQFSWIIVYPNDKEIENEIVVPIGKPIKINLTSEDVIHSLFIPAFRVKVDAVKGMSSYVWFYPDKEGTFMFHCTEYCGIGHSEMNGILRVVPEADYEAWLEEEE